MCVTRQILPHADARRRGAVCAHGRLVRQPVAPVLIRPAAHADPRAGANQVRAHGIARAQPQRRPAGREVAPAVGTRQPEATRQVGRPAASCRSSRAVGRRARASVNALDHLAGAQQDGGGMSRRLADDVDAPVHPVGEVHVRVAGATEHHRVARGAAAEGVRRRVGGAQVRLDLGQPDAHRAVVGAMPDEPAEQVAGHVLDRAGRRTDAVSRSVRLALPSPSSSPSRTRARAAASCSATRAGAVPPKPDRDSNDPRTVRTDADLRIEVRRDRRQVVVGQVPQVDAACFAEPHAGAGDLVRLPEGDAAADQPLRDVGRQREALRCGRGHAVGLEAHAWRPSPPWPAAPAATCRGSRRPAPCPPAGRGCRRTAGPSARSAPRSGFRSAGRTSRGPARRRPGSSSAA